MVEEGDVYGEQPEAPAPRKRFSMKQIIILGGIFFILVGGGFFAYTFLFSAKGDKHHKEKPEKKKVVEEEKPVLFKMEPFVVNLMDEGRFMKIGIEVQLADKKFEKLVEERIPLLRDAVIILLSSKSFAAISGPEGKFQLKDELLVRINQAIGQDVVKNLFFTEFVIQ